jgi:hypothetical protein
LQEGGYHGGGQGRPPLLAAVFNTDSVDRTPLVSLRTDLLEVHLYAILNWVFRVMHARPASGDALVPGRGATAPDLAPVPGVEAAFGLTAWRDKSSRERLCVLTWALAREDLFAILGTFKSHCMDPPCLAS